MIIIILDSLIYLNIHLHLFPFLFKKLFLKFHFLRIIKLKNL